MPMKFRIQVVRVAEDGAERMKEVMEFEWQELTMETLGMSLAEGKAVLKGVLVFRRWYARFRSAA